MRVLGAFAPLLLAALLFLAHLYVPLQMCAVHFTSVQQLLQRYIFFGHIYVLAYLNFSFTVFYSIFHDLEYRLAVNIRI